jgi:N-acetylglutamate synthase
MIRYRYENRLTRADVGRRVVVRRWVEDEERGLVPSDVLGVLESWSEGDVLTIRRRDGDLVEVAAEDILAAKTVPPPPA